MNPSERFFAKLRKLTVYLETESTSILQASQNLRDDDGESEENVAQTLYELHSEVKALKRQVQDQMSTHDARTTELRSFIRRCFLLKQRSSQDIDSLKKHFEKYGYRPRTSGMGDTVMNGANEKKELAEQDKSEVEEKEKETGEDVQQSVTSEKMSPSPDKMRTPKLSDFGLSALQFQRVFDGSEANSCPPEAALAHSTAAFVFSKPSPVPKTPKCSLRMDEDELTPRLEDFGISENTMCWNNDFTIDLLNKKPPKKNREKPAAVHLPQQTTSLLANGNQESPEIPVFCTPGLKIEKHRAASSPPLNGYSDLDSPPRPSNGLSTPELPSFETPFVSKLMKKNREEGVKSFTGSPEISLNLPNTDRDASVDVAPLAKILLCEDDPILEMPALQSLFGRSIAFKETSGESLSGIKTGRANGLNLEQSSVPVTVGFKQDWCLATPKVRMGFPSALCTPEMPDLSSVTQDILKLKAQCSLQQ